MPAIYIPNCELPTSGPKTLVLWPDGRVERITREFLPDKAIELGDHGSLIDADEMRSDWVENGENEYVYDTNAFLNDIDEREIVIPATKSGKSVPEEKGHWIYPSRNPECVNKELFVDCSECGYTTMDEVDVCPNCGKHMSVSEDAEEI